MKASEKARRFIQNHEGLRLEAYRCPSKVLTIGYGHTGNVKEGQVITRARAEELFTADLVRFENGVESAVKVPLQQHQFDALVSFAYNAGIMGFRSSTLLRLINAGKFAEAAREFERWVHGTGGVKLGGLVKRRAAEKAMFLGQ